MCLLSPCCEVASLSSSALELTMSWESRSEQPTSRLHQRWLCNLLECACDFGMTAIDEAAAKAWQCSKDLGAEQ